MLSAGVLAGARSSSPSGERSPKATRGGRVGSDNQAPKEGDRGRVGRVLCTVAIGELRQGRRFFRVRIASRGVSEREREELTAELAHELREWIRGREKPEGNRGL